MSKKTWAEFAWPEWVPAKLRASIENFWCADWGRGPDDWERSARGEHAPALGAEVIARDFHGTWRQGRYVHAWNNIGRVVDEAGNVYCVGSSDCMPATPQAIEAAKTWERALAAKKAADTALREAEESIQQARPA